MEDLTRWKIEQSRGERSSSHERLLEKSKSYRHFCELERSAFEEGSLSKKTKELMALSISIVTKCEPCMEWHVEQALRAGATEAEIHETIDVAMEMGGGPAIAYARFALAAFDHFRGATAATTPGSEG